MMRERLATPTVRLGAAMAAFALMTSGCGGDSDTASGGTGSSGSCKDKTITMGYVQGWTDHIMNAYFTKTFAEEGGYKVEVKGFSDLAPVFAATAKGDLDLMSAWPEKTHVQYMEQYGSDVEDLVTYNDNNVLAIAVPDYVSDDIKSIADLPAHASEFDGKIYGIEPGSGLAKLTQDEAIPAYGLDDEFELVLSSTPAMLTQLKKATQAEQPVAVTTWSPFWPNSTFNLRLLEDPEGAYGEAEGGHIIAHKGFSDECPEVASMLSNYRLTDAQYEEVENLLANKYEYDGGPAVEEWLAENPDFKDDMVKHLTS
jgi:glycine betaine/proline transport system substrate-binding protein